MADKMTVYVLRSKKTGRFFRFEQYAEDGWGEYCDDVSLPFSVGEPPSFFTHWEMFNNSTPRITLGNIVQPYITRSRNSRTRYIDNSDTQSRRT